MVQRSLHSMARPAIQCIVEPYLEEPNRMRDMEQQRQADGLLITYRCILSYCIQEQAKFSATYITPDIAQRIDETYAYIWHLKSQMRAAGLQVIDRPGDEPSAAQVSHDQPSQSVPAPPSDQQPPETDA